MMGTIRPDTRDWILSYLLTVSIYLIFCLSCDYLISPHDSLGSRSASFLELRVMWPTSNHLLLKCFLALKPMNTNCLGAGIVCDTVSLSTPFIGAAKYGDPNFADTQINNLDNSHFTGHIPKVVAP